MLISRRTFPPGAWSYFQPHTNWQAPPGLTFDQVVDAIIKHRRANPRFGLSTDRAAVETELDEYTCLRLGNDPAYCASSLARGPEKKVPSPLRLGAGKGVVAAAVKTVANTVAGIGLYLEWFGNGGPVSLKLAEERAKVCAKCPENDRQLSIFQHFTAAAAGELMKIMGALSDMHLEVANQAELGVCKACDCPMKAKVWSPLGIVLNHLRPESKSSLDKDCWILSEEKSLGKPTPQPAQPTGDPT